MTFGKHQIRSIPDLSLVLLGLVTLEGIVKHLDPTANMMTEVARFLGPRIPHERCRARGSRRWPRATAGSEVIAPDAAPVEPSKPWMRYAGMIESGDAMSSRRIDDVIYGQKD